MRLRLSIVLIVSLASITRAMGRAPTDPATWGDVTAVQDQVTAANAKMAAQQGQIQSQSDRIDELNAMKVMVEPVLRLYDGKRFVLEAFNDYDLAHSHEFAAGARITLKLGKSYESKQIERLEKEIASLRGGVLP